MQQQHLTSIYCHLRACCCSYCLLCGLYNMRIIVVSLRISLSLQLPAKHSKLKRSRKVSRQTERQADIKYKYEGMHGFENNNQNNISNSKGARCKKVQFFWHRTKSVCVFVCVYLQPVIRICRPPTEGRIGK